MKGPAAQLCWRRSFADAVTSVAVGDGPDIAVGVATGEIAYVSLLDGQLRWHATVHAAPVERVARLADGRAVSSGQDGAVWCTGSTGSPTKWLSTPGWVEQLAVQGQSVWIGAGRHLWRRDLAGEVQVRFEAPSTISGLAAVASGVVVSHFGGLTVVPGCSEEAHTPLPWRGSLLGVAVSPNGQWYAAPSQESTLQLWRARDGLSLAMQGFTERISALGWQMDSRVLITGCGPDLTLWDFRGAGPEGKPPMSLQIHDASVLVLANHPSRSIVLSADQTGLVVLTELGIGQARVLGDIATGERVLGAAWSDDGRHFLVWTVHGTVGCWRL
jgi:WD40 repeat protein